MLYLFSALLLPMALCLLIVLMIYLLAMKVSSDRESQNPFECGFKTYVSSSIPFSIRFYLVAVIFLIFDIELVVLFPLIFKMICSSFIGLAMSAGFILLLSLGLFHEWNQNLLNWSN